MFDRVTIAAVTTTAAPETPRQAGRIGRLPPLTAWLTHIYTATGAVLAFLALRATVAGDFRAAFLWLALSIVVDSTDGGLARLARVKDRLPEVDGSRLDDIVDYLTFVFVPGYLLYESGALPAGWGLGVVFAMLLASAIGFSKSDAKTDDHFFTGFPSYWSIVAFYLVAARIPANINAAIILVLCALVFVRIGYVYPSRTPALRGVTLALGYAWGALLLYLIWRYPAVDGRLLLASVSYPLYYLVLSLVLHAGRR